MKKKIIVVMGKTSSGKDTVCKYLSDVYGIPMIVSNTTRPMRSYETNGVQHYFVSEEEMDVLEKRKDLLAWTRFPKTNYRYCATVSGMTDNIMTYILNPDGVDFLEKNKEKLQVDYRVIYLNIPTEQLVRRALDRGDNPQAVHERISSESMEFDEFYKRKRYDYNIDASKSFEDVRSDIDHIMWDLGILKKTFCKVTGDDDGLKVVDTTTRKIYSYCNRMKCVTYNAQEVVNGKPTNFFVNYTDCDTVDDISQRVMTWNNPIKLAYARAVQYFASKNDPDSSLWNKIVEYVSNHPDQFFDEYGDWKKNLVITQEQIKSYCM